MDNCWIFNEQLLPAEIVLQWIIHFVALYLWVKKLKIDVIVAQLTERSILTKEGQGLNPVNGSFCWPLIYLLFNVHKKM